MKVLKYMFRIWITPLMISVVIFTAYQLGLLINQTVFIVLLLASGISGQLIQVWLENRQKNKQQKIRVQEAEREETKEDPLEKLPKKVQDLIKEAESLNEEVQK